MVKVGEALYAFGALIEVKDLSPQCRRPYVEPVLDPVELVGVDVVLADLSVKDAVHQFELCDEHRNLEPWVAFDCSADQLGVGEPPGCADRIDVEEVARVRTAVERAELVVYGVLETDRTSADDGHTIA
jgi:hypothetical protein